MRGALCQLAQAHAVKLGGCRLVCPQDGWAAWVGPCGRNRQQSSTPSTQGPGGRKKAETSRPRSKRILLPGSPDSAHSAMLKRAPGSQRQASGSECTSKILQSSTVQPLKHDEQHALHLMRTQKTAQAPLPKVQAIMQGSTPQHTYRVGGGTACSAAPAGAARRPLAERSSAAAAAASRLLGCQCAAAARWHRPASSP